MRGVSSAASVTRCVTGRVPSSASSSNSFVERGHERLVRGDRHLAVEQLARLRRAEHRRHRERLAPADVVDVRVREQQAPHRARRAGRPRRRTAPTASAPSACRSRSGRRRRRPRPRCSPPTRRPAAARPTRRRPARGGCGLGAPPWRHGTLSKMSERSRNLPRRSCLSIPGSSEKMLAKAPESRCRHGVPRSRGRGGPAREAGRARQDHQRDQHARLGRDRAVRARERVGHRVDVPRRDRDRRGRVASGSTS